MTLAVIYFISCHGGPAAHMAEFANELTKKGHQVEILATGPALDKFRQLHVGAKECNPDKLDLDNAASRKVLAAQIGKMVGPAQAVITDVGHLLMTEVHQELGSRVRHLAYYDNPESFVPGGYSKTAAAVMACANKVLFANKNLAKEPIFEAPGEIFPLPLEKRIGIGYYPLASAAKLKIDRANRKGELRAAFFQKHQILDRGQKILVYFGGNNDAYFEKAFPAFLKMLPKGHLVILQQHPGAKAKNIDGFLASPHPEILPSTMSTDEAQILADAALYYQTSMGPQWALAGLPAIQVAHESYPDILVRNQLAPSVFTADGLLKAIEEIGIRNVNEEQLLKGLGIDPNSSRVLSESICLQ